MKDHKFAFIVPVYTIPSLPFWYEPMGRVLLEPGEKVIIESTDGTKKRIDAWVLNKKKGIGDGVWYYRLGKQHQLTYL